MRCWGNKNWVPTRSPPPPTKPKLACLLFRKLQKCLQGDGRGKLGSFSFFKSMLLDKRRSLTNVGAVVGDKVTRPIMTPIFVRETGCFKNSLNTMTCGTAREINSNLCGFFYWTYYKWLYIFALLFDNYYYLLSLVVADSWQKHLLNNYLFS